jgi:hypothetical protein
MRSRFSNWWPLAANDRTHTVPIAIIRGVLRLWEAM